jgi:hypothetical protein
MVWYKFQDGMTVGRKGSENGIIVSDEEHPDGARITLERSGRKDYTITCGIYGWMVHTRFFSNEVEARDAFEQMKDELTRIINLIPSVDEANETKLETASEAMVDFVIRFP